MSWPRSVARLPDPTPGLVIRYAYLWQREALLAREEGTKHRPAVVILASTADENAGTTVLVAPLTHRRPDNPNTAIEVPPRTRTRLGLDDERSWVVVSEVNRFQWPGPDLRPVAPGQWAYGWLPAALFRTVRDRLVALARQRKLAQVRRTP